MGLKLKARGTSGLELGVCLKMRSRRLLSLFLLALHSDRLFPAATDSYYIMV